MTKVTLIKDKAEFYAYAKEHTMPEIAERFNLDHKYVKNYLGNHKVPHKNLDIWHGKSDKRIYIIYQAMIARCYYKKHPHYKDYGGRGIGVCNEWKSDRKSFFLWAELNGYSDTLQLDRIDNNKDYSPSNCRFVPNVLNQNNRRCTKYYKGIAIGLIAHSKECNPLNLKQCLLYKRLTGDNGRVNKWDIVTALATPVTNIKGSHKILPIDKEAEILVRKNLQLYFPQVFE